MVTFFEHCTFKSLAIIVYYLLLFTRKEKRKKKEKKSLILQYIAQCLSLYIINIMNRQKKNNQNYCKLLRRQQDGRNYKVIPQKKKTIDKKSIDFIIY